MTNGEPLRPESGGALALAGIVLFGVLAIPQPASAQEWTASGSVGQSFRYEDNIGLNEFEIDDMNSSTSGSVELGVRSPTAFINLGAEIDFVRYFRETDLDSNEAYVDLNSGVQVGRSRFGLGAEAVFDTTRRSQFDDLGVGILANKPRNTFSISPTWDYQWTPTDVVGLFLNARLERFPNESGGLNNESYTGSGTYSKQLTPLTSFQSAVTYGYYTSEVTETNGVSVVGGLDMQITPRWRAGLLIGPRFTHSEDKINDTESDNVGVTLSADTRYDLTPYSSISGQFENGLVPSSSGEAQRFTSVRGIYRHELLPKVFFDASARFDTRERLDTDGSDSRENIRVSPRIRWQFVDDWELTGLYEFKWNSPAGGDETFTSNAFFVGLTYRSPRWFVWR
ncbi:MAG: hypothetical protein KIT00_04180 [Rhodospirillales bacterium]|nr:hypothetical protein [Rhodospirillales bacterium]